MPTSTRPGGRTAAVRDAVLRAAADLLIEDGLEGIELTAVAQRAGVGKSTVYRRWGSVPGLVADLLVDMADTSTPRPSTGALRTDLLAQAKLVRRTLADARQGRLFKAIIAAATCDAATAKALAEFYRKRIDEVSPVVVDAVARSEAPAGTDPAEVIRQLSAPLYYRFLTDTKPLTNADAERAVAVTMAAVDAEVFVTR
ncbi:TetR/AcrR family transcriptional regulator [Mycolicibacterium sp. P9-64]|uniref:TetR/AcrR family transcriptional regulator n=1 Tax=Mycolicibacterium sp. P9-64 TaxID=2024612 RepID=UPI0011F07F31|nr:TetR/AcrR family transcriptional regulator [Mycolicibacterium sp. P9-64]KAA0081237.1 TetR/AcrR family transcriptional regulator [Mycolicibacterium sp. P9-64]